MQSSVDMLSLLVNHALIEIHLNTGSLHSINNKPVLGKFIEFIEFVKR